MYLLKVVLEPGAQEVLCSQKCQFQSSIVFRRQVLWEMGRYTRLAAQRWQSAEHAGWEWPHAPGQSPRAEWPDDGEFLFPTGQTLHDCHGSWISWDGLLRMQPWVRIFKKHDLPPLDLTSVWFLPASRQMDGCFPVQLPWSFAAKFLTQNGWLSPVKPLSSSLIQEKHIQGFTPFYRWRFRCDSTMGPRGQPGLRSAKEAASGEFRRRQVTTAPENKGLFWLTLTGGLWLEHLDDFSIHIGNGVGWNHQPVDVSLLFGRIKTHDNIITWFLFLSLKKDMVGHLGGSSGSDLPALFCCDGFLSMTSEGVCLHGTPNRKLCKTGSDNGVNAKWQF